MAEKTYDGFTDEERAAMKARAAELKTARKPGSKKAEAERQALLDTIAGMPEGEQTIANRVHEIVTTDTVPHTLKFAHPKLTVLSAAPAFAEAVRRIHSGESVSALFS